MPALNLLTININGRKDGLKKFQLFEYLKSIKADIFCLQESHTLELDKAVWLLTWRGHCYFCNLSASCDGVVILFNPGLSVKVLDEICVVQGWAFHLKFEIDDTICDILNIYAPTYGRERVNFYSNIYDYLHSINDCHYLVIVGDFNCTLNAKLDRGSDTETHKPSALILIC